MRALSRRVVAEFIGAAFLLAGVVGSGIMAQRLAAGNVALALLANAIATGGVLGCMIAAFGPISGAHFNPAVSLAAAIRGILSWADACAYIVAQVAGAIAGVAAANVMFGLPVFFAAQRVRSGPAQWFAEVIATFGLLLVIWCCVRFAPNFTAVAVAVYIVAAYWFTSSTSFANPAVTIARALSDTFAGIRPVDVPPFIVAQMLGAVGATALFSWLVPREDKQAVA